ncbi:hypothetical protein SBV1_10047 [Verrucomicrobia bacterium]|nr:hypothetical protein SBV1_10047 [Verrucomicrobiota bacterium]
MEVPRAAVRVSAKINSDFHARSIWSTPARRYPKKRLLDITLALPRKSGKGPPLPDPLLPRKAQEEREKRFARLEDSDTVWVMAGAALAGRKVRGTLALTPALSPRYASSARGAIGPVHG